MEDYAIQVENLSKMYKLFDNNKNRMRDSLGLYKKNCSLCQKTVKENCQKSDSVSSSDCRNLCEGRKSVHGAGNGSPGVTEEAT